MKKIECEIVGASPILMNSPKAMLEVQEGTSLKTKKRKTKKKK